MASLTRDTPRLIIEYLTSICSRTANFDNVRQHEPKSKPTGFEASVFMSTLRPAASGLAITSVRAEFTIRIYQNMLMEPQDAIDSFLAAAVWDVMAAISADVTLGGLVRSVSLLGEEGDALNAENGYIDVDHAMFRVSSIVVPVIINDAFDQVRTT